MHAKAADRSFGGGGPLRGERATVGKPADAARWFEAAGSLRSLVELL
jgi:hypothetical protein